MKIVHPPLDRDDWLELTRSALSAGAAHDWAVRPDCGGVVVFSGTVRDHAEGRPGVTELTYEAYEEQVLPRLAALAAEVRSRWAQTGRLALWHRIGTMAVGEVSVVVAVSAPHRGEAFEAARFAIDTLKATIPIWKHERWAGGEDWGTGAQDVTEAGTRH